MCRSLGVSRSGFYAFCQEPLTKREARDLKLLPSIKRIHAESRGTYGSPRVRAALCREGQSVSKHRVERIMRDKGLAGKVRKRFRSTTDSKHDRPVAANHLGRQFDTQSADSAWCADITQLDSKSGPLYLAAILDLGTRLIVGWSIGTSMETTLVETALLNALSWRKPADEMIHHSDRGSQYASNNYQMLLSANEIRCSMSRKGNCWDNAAMESFFGTFKQEMANHVHWKDLEEARAATMDYIEVFYNRQRIHSALGYRTPNEADEAAA